MNKKIPNSLTVLVLTVFTILVWISLEVYRSFTDPVDIEVPDEILEPISPNLDINALAEIENSLFLSDQELEELRQLNPLIATPSATIIPTIIEEVTPTPIPEESPIPTESEEEF